MTWPGPPVVVAIFVAAQVLVSAAAIGLGELVVEEGAARIGEWIASLGLAVAFLLALLEGGVDPFLAAGAALAGGVGQFLVAAGLARLGGHLVDLGTDWDGLGPVYPVAAAVAVAVVFTPTGLGPGLGAPELYDGLRVHYAVAVGLAAAIVGLFLALEDRRLAWILRVLLTVVLLAAFEIVGPAAGVDRGRATVASLALASIVGVLGLAARFVVALVAGGEPLDREAVAGEAKLLLAGYGAVLAAWILPLFRSA